jgi:hypothetical protein
MFGSQGSLAFAIWFIFIQTFVFPFGIIHNLLGFNNAEGVAQQQGSLVYQVPLFASGSSSKIVDILPSFGVNIVSEITRDQ